MIPLTPPEDEADPEPTQFSPFDVEITAYDPTPYASGYRLNKKTAANAIHPFTGLAAACDIFKTFAENRQGAINKLAPIVNLHYQNLNRVH